MLLSGISRFRVAKHCRRNRAVDCGADTLQQCCGPNERARPTGRLHCLCLEAMVSCGNAPEFEQSVRCPRDPLPQAEQLCGHRVLEVMPNNSFWLTQDADRAFRITAVRYVFLRRVAGARTWCPTRRKPWLICCCAVSTGVRVLCRHWPPSRRHLRTGHPSISHHRWQTAFSHQSRLQGPCGHSFRRPLPRPRQPQFEAPRPMPPAQQGLCQS